MIICLVTDRRQLAPAAPPDVARAALVAQARAAVDAGIDLLQIRERDLEARELAAVVSEILAISRGTATRVVVNDRLDVALACGADGVHLRADSIAVAAARGIVPDRFLIGRSVHGAADLAESRGADYLIAGTVFRSAAKPPNHQLLGVDGLRAIVERTGEVGAARPVQVLAIGGIAEDRLEEVAGAGAAGVAGIGLFAVTSGDALKTLVARARLRFDSARSGP